MSMFVCKQNLCKYHTLIKTIWLNENMMLGILKTVEFVFYKKWGEMPAAFNQELNYAFICT